MISKLASNRIARKTGRKLGKRGITTVPLHEVKRIVQRVITNLQDQPVMPPEKALQEGNDLKIVAFETAVAVHQSMIQAQPEYLRGIDVHRWPKRIGFSKALF